jgi:hypothetical protein
MKDAELAPIMKAAGETLAAFAADEWIERPQIEDRIWWYDEFMAQDKCLRSLKGILEKAEYDDQGCLIIAGSEPYRLRVRGRRMRAYQYVYWAHTALIPGPKDVVRHLCHNRQCINPDHLCDGSQQQNIRDEILRRAGQG